MLPYLLLVRETEVQFLVESYQIPLVIYLLILRAVALSN